MHELAELSRWQLHIVLFRSHMLVGGLCKLMSGLTVLFRWQWQLINTSLLTVRMWLQHMEHVGNIIRCRSCAVHDWQMEAQLVR